MDLLRVISHHQARLATPIRTVQKMYREPDLDNIPFADTTFNSRAAAMRSLLLIEPPYKIHSDEKTKPSTCSTQNNEEKNENVEPALASESKTDTEDGSNRIDESKKEVEDVWKEKSGVRSEAFSKNESKRSDSPSSASQQGKQDVESISLEENIVLGVALDGSKRTLPIEDEIVPLESKELAPTRNGAGKDNKDGQMPIAPNSPQMD